MQENVETYNTNNDENVKVKAKVYLLTIIMALAVFVVDQQDTFNNHSSQPHQYV